MTRMLIFFAVTTALWVLVHFYVGRRLINSSSLSERTKRIAWGIMLSVMTLGPAAMIVARTAGNGPMVAFFQWGAYAHMGLFLLLLFFVLVRDTVWLSGKAYQRYVLKRKRELIASPERRQFLTNSVNAGILGATGALSAVGYKEALTPAEINKVEVPIPDLPEALDGFRIAQISDVHIGPTLKRPFLDAVVERVNSLDADMIAITGDLIDGYVDIMGDQIEPLADLRARYGAFFVTGNHEYYWDGPAWVEHVRSLGVVPLINEHTLIEHNGGKLLVGGVTDYRAGSREEGHETDPHGALAGAPESDLKLLLAHQPKSVFEAAKAGWDLQLSGHTHGGQFFPITLFAGLAHPFTAGLHQHDNLQIFVSRGTGYWGPPMRLGAPSEITELTLRRA